MFCVMANIQVKNVPEKLHNQLRRYAREKGCTLGEIIVEAIKREVARREWHKGFSGRPSTQLRSSAAQLLREERRQRGQGSSVNHLIDLSGLDVIPKNRAAETGCAELNSQRLR